MTVYSYFVAIFQTKIHVFKDFEDHIVVSSVVIPPTEIVEFDLMGIKILRQVAKT